MTDRIHHRDMAPDAPDNQPEPPPGAKHGKMAAAVRASEAAMGDLLDLPLGSGGETQQRDGTGILTTDHGVPISDNQNSLKAGPRGPVLLEDFVLREKIFHFDHERIPERIVHARGSGAHGTFTVTRAIPELTRAALFQKAGNSCETFTRFSTVAGSKGSKDTPRDVRGFATKLYTAEGNWDLVANNFAPFFVQDALKFPDLIHAVKPEADRMFPQAASAHDTFWDFVSLMPETMHTVMWLMSDRALPRSYRMMEGFGVHTFRMVNAEGKASFVKFHWKPRLGVQSLLWDEAVKIGGADPDFNRRDLWEAIDRGDFPEFDLGIQVFDAAFASAQFYDVLDATKIIPEEDVPVQIIGTLQLNRNPDNFFAETEQVAFMPQNVPPGIDFSDDPLLQGRLFSYLDTQKSRLGTTNFFQIPINAPRCPFANMQRDGMMQTLVHKGRANYEPNSLDKAGEDQGPRPSEQGFETIRRMDQAEDANQKLRVRADSFRDHFSHARLFYRSQTPVEQDHIVNAFTFELSKVDLPHVRLAVLAQLRNVDETMAARVAKGLALDLPPRAAPASEPVDMPASDALSILKNAAETLEGRKVGILMDEDSDASQVRALVAAIKAAGGVAMTIAPRRGLGDGQLDGTPSVVVDAIALVLTEAAARKLCQHKPAIDFVSDAFAHCKAIGHAAGAQPLLDKAGVVADAGVVPLDALPAAAVRRYHDREARIWAAHP